MTSGDRIIQLLDSYPSTGSAFRWYRQKPNGEARPMATPNAALKKWQRDMNTALNKHFSSWPDFMHGGIKKRSYVSFAQPHVDKPYVITIDVKQCFDSITVREVSMAMKRHLELSTDVCRRLANKLCFRGKIAQGFPTSNYICNLYLLGPLTSLQSSLKEQGIEFGNYVDDLALSGNIVSPDIVINEVGATLSRAHLKMNKAKIRVMPASKRQLICGLIVNKRLSLTKGLKRKLMSDVAYGRINSVSVDGWVANLRSFDSIFGNKLKIYATRKGLYDQRAM